MFFAPAMPEQIPDNFASIRGGKKLNLSPCFDPTNCAAVILVSTSLPASPTLVAAVRRQLPSVLVVDDGSTDATAGLVKNAGAVVVKHERNLGKGAALKSGLARALKLGCEWAVTLDGDGQHAPEDLPALIRCAGKPARCW